LTSTIALKRRSSAGAEVDEQGQTSRTTSPGTRSRAGAQADSLHPGAGLQPGSAFLLPSRCLR
jgi:hypothetical protein